MTTWQVLGYEVIDNDHEAQQDIWGWREIGTHESDYSHYPGHDAAEKLGEKFGAGEFLLLQTDGSNYKRITVGSRQEFYEVEVEDTAEAIMAREG